MSWFSVKNLKQVLQEIRLAMEDVKSKLWVISILSVTKKDIIGVYNKK